MHALTRSARASSVGAPFVRPPPWPQVTRAVLEETEASRAIFTLYEGALFHHQGASYLVRELRYHERIALVERRSVPYWTRQHDYTDVQIIHRHQACSTGASTAIYGDMRIRKVVYQYAATAGGLPRGRGGGGHHACVASGGRRLTVRTRAPVAMWPQV